MKIRMRNNAVYKTVFFYCMLLMSFCEISGRMLKNFIDIEKEENHVSFNHFFPVIIEKASISNGKQTGESCGTCNITNDQHIHLNRKNDLGWYDKCFGKLNSCSPVSSSSILDRSSKDCSGNCACFCYTNGLRDHKQQIDSVCLDPVFVNVSDHQVITGVRFTTVRNILMLQVQAGTLQDGITIRRGSNHWVLSERSCYKVAPILHDQTKFALDNITLPAEYGITGLSLRMCVENWEYSSMKIKTIRRCVGGDDFIFLTAYGTSFKNIYNGKNKIVIEGEKVHNNRSFLHRLDYTRPNMGDPINAEKMDLKEQRGHSVTFRSAQHISNDATPIIPYISTKVLSSKPSKPLVGIEMIYYGDDYNGGYISFVIYTN